MHSYCINKSTIISTWSDVLLHEFWFSKKSLSMSVIQQPLILTQKYEFVHIRSITVLLISRNRTLGILTILWFNKVVKFFILHHITFVVHIIETDVVLSCMNLDFPMKSLSPVCYTPTIYTYPKIWISSFKKNCYFPGIPLIN